MVHLSDKLYHKNVSKSVQNLLKDSPNLLIHTKDDAEVGVRGSLLIMFSNYFGSCLASISSTSTPTLFLPDFSSSTVHRLIEILTKGGTAAKLDDVGIEHVTSLAGILGIKLDNIERVSSKNVFSNDDNEAQRKVKGKTTSKKSGEIVSNEKLNHEPENKSNAEVSFAKKLEEELSNLLFRGQENKIINPNIGSEDAIRTDESIPLSLQEGNHADEVDDTITVKDKTCEECHKQLPSVSLLGYHYCKHFLESLKSPKFFHTWDDKKCLKCDQTFYDRTTLLSHLGVKHELINEILKAKGVTEVAFWKVKSRKMAMSVKKEVCSFTATSGERNVEDSSSTVTEPMPDNQNKCEVCGESFTSHNKLAQHACNHFLAELRSFSGLYDGNTCKLCDIAYSTEFALMIHLGWKHQKINDVLKSKGYKPLVLRTVDHRTPPGPRNESTIQSPSFSMLSTINSETNSTLSESSLSCETSGGDDLNTTSQVLGQVTEQSTFLSHVNMTPGTDKSSTSNQKGDMTFRPSVNSTPAVNMKKTAGPSSTMKSFKKKRHPCEICDKECNYPGYLAQHYCDSHFNEILKQEVAKKFDEKKCKDCEKTINSSQDQIRHVGMKHGIINTLLEKKGLKSVAFKFYKYNTPASKIAALKQAAAIVTSNMFVDETIQEETSEEVSNLSTSDEKSSMMDTDTEDGASNLEQTSIMVRTDLCSISKQLEGNEGSSFSAEDTTLTDDDGSLTNEDTNMSNDESAVDMDTTCITGDSDSGDEALSPMILDTFSLKENGHDIDGKLLVSG